MSGGDNPWEKGIFTEHGGGAQQALEISIFNFLALRLESDDQLFMWGFEGPDSGSPARLTSHFFRNN